MKPNMKVDVKFAPERMGDRVVEPRKNQIVWLTSVMPGNHGDSQERYTGPRELKTPVLVKVTGGSFMGDYDRVSNFFYWREIREDGSISREYCGYPAFRECKK